MFMSHYATEVCKCPEDHHLKKNKKTAKVVRFQVDYYLTKIKPHIPSGHTVRTEKQT